MAILVTKTVVCDVGREKCPTDELETVVLTVGGKRAKQVLCPKHAAPFRTMLEKMGGGGQVGRGRVYTPDEIAARKRTTAKKR